ncbi:helix-turn-helix domain-containing protein [Ochrobactrum sp. A-1]|nr:helix-turn-helix domain-containing protein [Ochrobactrum sp. A-1]
MTEAEVAARMRCSRSKIKALRLSGKLPYLPGRPVLIDEKDLNEYLERIKCQTHRTLNEPAMASITSTGQSSAWENGSALALKIWNKRRASFPDG